MTFLLKNILQRCKHYHTMYIISFMVLFFSNCLQNVFVKRQALQIFVDIVMQFFF